MGESLAVSLALPLLGHGGPEGIDAARTFRW
jgi:hypothetical protein